MDLALERISVIVPCYYSHEKVIKLLQSIETNFNNLNYDVLLIDDSNDETEYKMLTTVAGNYKCCSVYKNKRGKGAGGARNSGLEFAEGKWVLFADSDDHYLLGAGTNLLKQIASEADLIIFPPTSTDSNGKEGIRHVTFQRTIKENQVNQDEMLLRCQLPCVWSKLYRRKLISEHQIWFDEIAVSNDVMFSLKTGLHASKICLSPDIIYSWDYNENSLTTGMSRDRFLIDVDVTCRYNNYLKANLNRLEYKKNRHSAIKSIVFSLFRHGFGIKYTLNILNIFIRNKVPLVVTADLRLTKISNTIRNNRLYRK